MHEATLRSPSLVIYDDSADTADVLAAVYGPRGIHVQRIPRALAPRVPAEAAVLVTLEETRRTGSDRGIVVGQILRPDSVSEDSRQTICELPALFRYGDLIDAIDRCLADAAA
jgi:hypothetical protein